MIGFVAVMTLAAPLFWLAREHRAWRKLREHALLREQILAEPRARGERGEPRAPSAPSAPRPSHA